MTDFPNDIIHDIEACQEDEPSRSAYGNFLFETMEIITEFEMKKEKGNGKR
jgi:hypothetical protein